MQQEIAELKQDMRKYNNVLERLIHVEDNVQLAARRIDIIEENYENIRKKDYN